MIQDLSVNVNENFNKLQVRLGSIEINEVMNILDRIERSYVDYTDASEQLSNATKVLEDLNGNNSTDSSKLEAAQADIDEASNLFEVYTAQFR